MSSSFEMIGVEPGVPIKAWTKGVPLEDATAAQQLRNVARLPFVFKHVAAMPDVHWGMGATVGSVIATKGAIVPAAVGVDIGCGMAAAMTSLSAAGSLPDGLAAMRSAIRRTAVPCMARTDNGGKNDRGAWGEGGSRARRQSRRRPRRDRRDGGRSSISRRAARAGACRHALGTRQPLHRGLPRRGGTRVWVMLHSGSRGIGNAIGSRFIELPRPRPRCVAGSSTCRTGISLTCRRRARSAFRRLCRGGRLQAQDYARANRELMMRATVAAMQASLGRAFEAGVVAVNCHHNYVSRERHFGENVLVTRKGAVRAREGDLGIIPGSMGAKSFIVRGKGNPESFMSCSHGAGRKMSRAAAKKTFTLADHSAATLGVECRKDDGVLDETPGAYKAIDDVMAAQEDLVEIVHTLGQVLCVKG